MGLYSEFQISEKFFFSPELIFSIDGGKFNTDLLSMTDRFTYISIPLLVKFYTSEKMSLHAGPQLGGLLNAKRNTKGTEENLKELLNLISLSFDFGAEVHFNSFNIGGRYILGLSNVNDDSNLSIKLNTIQIYAAFPFPF